MVSDLEAEEHVLLKLYLRFSVGAFYTCGDRMQERLFLLPCPVSTLSYPPYQLCLALYFEGLR